ncbi:RNA polymerase sigma factor [Paenibacillus psychroresistens]|uniref:RNA polymerase sigma factor n=1 Tax=Paenibacillus psychroresistens TaxID=1778678 RepID=A0A6B8RDZ7_9BACL|nr:RNA polymerase sigma factor [Paenibacillus psychroresistens]QGQ94147.1 RNA polymerase sigma factor [Paenibacillus psychroresistens]
MDLDYLEHMNTIEIPQLKDIMEFYGEDIWNYAYFITKNHSLADDIAQEVFFKAYKHIATFRGGSSLKTWLLKITRNTALSFLKLAFVRKVSLVGFIFNSGTSPSPESQFFAQFQLDEMWSIVMSLPIKFREVLILHAHYELSMEEISSTLDISIGTVKSRLNRARSKSIKQLKEREIYE